MKIHKIAKAYVFYVEPKSKWMGVRPDGDEVYLLHWSDLDIMVPWPMGISAREALLLWAKGELEKDAASDA